MVQSCAAYNCTNRRVKGSGISFHQFPTDPHLKQLWVIATERVEFEPTTRTVLCSKHFRQEDFENRFGQRKLKEGVIPSVFDFSSNVIKQTKHKTHLTKNDAILKNKEPSLGMTIKNIVNVQKITDVIKAVVPKRNTEENLESTLDIDTNIMKDSIETEKNKGFSTSMENSITRAISSNIMFPSKKRKHYMGDFTLNDMNSQKKAKLMLNMARKEISQKNFIIQYLRCKSFRLVKRIQTLEKILQRLKKQNKSDNELFDF